MIMKLYAFCITFMLPLLSCFGQETHIIEPSILEISYHTKYLSNDKKITWYFFLSLHETI